MKPKKTKSALRPVSIRVPVSIAEGMGKLAKANHTMVSWEWTKAADQHIRRMSTPVQLDGEGR